MLNTLLAILAPAAPVEGADVSQQDASNALSAGQGSPSAFGQMLSDIQARQTPAAPTKQPPSLRPIAPGMHVLVPAEAPIELQATPQTTTQAVAPQVTVEEIRALAASSTAVEKVAPARESSEDTAAQEVTQNDPLPSIDPVAAFSLVPSPIAYTSDAEVAAVVVDDAMFQAGANPAVTVDPREAFALLADLAPAAGEQRLTLQPKPVVSTEEIAVAQADMPESPEALVPQAQSQPVGPEVELPEYPVTQLQGPQTPEEALAQLMPLPPMKDMTQQEVAEALVATVPQAQPSVLRQAPLPVKDDASFAPVEQMAEAGETVDEALDVDNDTQDADAGSVAVPMGGPFVPIDALDTESAESLPKQPEAVAPAQPKHTPATPAAPEGDMQGGGSSGQDAQDDGSGYQPFKAEFSMPKATGEAAGRPEASVKPEHAGSDDFATLLSDKVQPQPGVASQLQQTQGLDSTKDIPQVKLAHATSHTPVEEQVSVNIRQALDDGADQIIIRLNPPELGKLHIKMDIAQDGRAHVVVTADNKDTFDMLQRDARGLERALGDAGVKTDSGSLQFDLRGQSQQQQGAAGFEFDQQNGQGRQPGDTAGMSQQGEGAKSASAGGIDDEVALSLHRGQQEYVISVADGVDIRV